MTVPTNTLACPRCGYDVSGVVPKWTEKCPLEGTCSECGLVYLWVDIFRPERLHPAWSFEHVKRKRVRAFFRTVIRAFRPASIWREMSISAPIRLGRLAILVIASWLLVHLLACSLATWTLWPELTWGLRGTSHLGGTFDWPLMRSALAWPYSQNYRHTVEPLALLATVWGLLIPLPFLILRQSMRTARCRLSHLLRGWACFMPAVASVIAFELVASYAISFVPKLSWTLWARSATPLHRWEYAVWSWMGLVIFIAAGLWAVRWWWLFTKDYLRLEQPRLVVALMVVVSFLTALAGCAFVNNGELNLFGGAVNFFLG